MPLYGDLNQREPWLGVHIVIAKPQPVNATLAPAQTCAYTTFAGHSRTPVQNLAQSQISNLLLPPGNLVKSGFLRHPGL